MIQKKFYVTNFLNFNNKMSNINKIIFYAGYYIYIYMKFKSMTQKIQITYKVH